MYEKHEYKMHDIIFQKLWKISKRGVYSQIQAFGLKLNRGQIRFQSSKSSPKQVFQEKGIIFLKFNLFLDQFVNEMCRCRTSMEHFRVKNYLARNGELDDWEHHDETCKWCAFPNSKKCWQCQVHWKKASDNENINREARVRNEQIEMACFLYVKNVKNGKVIFKLENFLCFSMSN